MNKNKEYIYITRTMKINVPAIYCQDAIDKIELMKKKDLIPKELGFLYTRCRVRDNGRDKYGL
tara:strand:+ start:1183 stop:1371 length:189 start_codon:yes stop_codon:yes gene_type:complete